MLLACGQGHGSRPHRDDASSAVSASDARPREDMVTIPAGRYRLSALHYRDDGVCTPELAGDPHALLDVAHPATEQDVARFEIDRVPVRWRDYCSCVKQGACPVRNAGDCQYRRDLADDDPESSAKVLRTTAIAYCAWRGLRLPTFVEWQAAVRGPKGQEVAGCDVASTIQTYRCQFTSPSAVRTWMSDAEFTRSRECFPAMSGDPLHIAPVAVSSDWMAGYRLDVATPADDDRRGFFRCVRDTRP
ncbi:MAG TPA: SUMF1/EgtB/PvdO family nonheme iron enzyme [Kofleriaceae bacterium]|nr:SUMF1/EgtB/PvdO family nonheme iron enzyme [Kofleriaceae bacterium]